MPMVGLAVEDWAAGRVERAVAPAVRSVSLPRLVIDSLLGAKSGVCADAELDELLFR